MNKDLLNNIDLGSDNFYNFLDTEVKKAWIESYYSTLSGWHFDLYFDGEFNVSGPLSQGSYLGGDNITLARIELGNELPDIVDFSNVESLEDFGAFKVFAIEREYDVLDLLEKTPEEKDELFYDISGIDGLYAEFNRDNYKTLTDEAIDLIWDNYGRDKILERAENTVDMLKEADI